MLEQARDIRGVVGVVGAVTPTFSQKHDSTSTSTFNEADVSLVLARLVLHSHGTSQMNDKNGSVTGWLK